MWSTGIFIFDSSNDNIYKHIYYNSVLSYISLDFNNHTNNIFIFVIVYKFRLPESLKNFNISYKHVDKQSLYTTSLCKIKI
jgi:hypothetical protein